MAQAGNSDAPVVELEPFVIKEPNVDAQMPSEVADGEKEVPTPREIALPPQTPEPTVVPMPQTLDGEASTPKRRATGSLRQPKRKLTGRDGHDAARGAAASDFAIKKRTLTGGITRQKQDGDKGHDGSLFVHSPAVKAAAGSSPSAGTAQNKQKKHDKKLAEESAEQHQKKGEKTKKTSNKKRDDGKPHKMFDDPQRSHQKRR